MKEHPAFTASTEEVIELFASQRLARIVTIDPDGIPRVGIHVFVHDGLVIEMHLAKDDTQLADIQRGSPVVIEADEVLSSAASHWIDEENATHADHFYRFASVWGATELITTPEAIAAHLRRILAKYQPEGRHSPVTESAESYRDAIRFLEVVRVHGTSIRSKFKLAQTTEPKTREEIVRRLSEGGDPTAVRTAGLIRKASPGARQGT
jgi:transcriptional regulator